MRQTSFFSDVVPEPGVDRNLAALKEAGCSLCSLNCVPRRYPVHHPYMDADGAGFSDTRYYVLGEAPGAEEDSQGRPFVGPSGRLIREHPDFDDRHTRIWNTIRCRPPDNRTPTEHELASCSGFIEDDIRRADPSAILLVGGTAFRWATGLSNVTYWSGKWVVAEIGGRRYAAMPVIHPAYVLRHGGEGFMRAHFEAVLERFFCESFDCENLKLTGTTGETLADIDEAIADNSTESLITHFAGGHIGLDIETATDETGGRVFRPYGKGAEILSVAISNFRTSAVFVGEDEIKRLVRFLMDFSGVVMAHNLAFDLEWLYYFHPELRGKVRWYCTLAMAYITDPRPTGKSLNDLCSAHLGLRDIKAHSGVDVSDLRSAPADLLKRYNARDAFLCVRIAHDFLERQKDKTALCRFVVLLEEQSRRIEAAVASQLRGIPFDRDAAKELSAELDAGMTEAQREFSDSRAVCEWSAKIGRRLTIADNRELADFIAGSGHKNLIASDERKSGVSVDEAALHRVAKKIPAVEWVIQYRKLAKIKSTYVDNLATGKDEWPDGLLHPQYSVNSQRSRRSSCSGPNIQNQPKRGPMSSAVRGLIRDPDGGVFVSVDYGQIEARVVAMASRDPFLVKSIRTGYDIHADWGRRILEAHPGYHERGREALDDESAFKEVRRKAKGWVFGNLFGSTLKGAIEHVGADESVVRPLYQAFWKQMPRVKEWHEEVWSQYERDGYAETLTGFRRPGPLRYNEVINLIPQAVSFDLVADTWCRICERCVREDRLDLVPPMQIHDDLTWVVPEDAIEDLLALIREEVFNWDFKAFPFLPVIPMTAEISIGTDWSNMEELDELTSDWTCQDLFGNANTLRAYETYVPSIFRTYWEDKNG